MSKSLGQIAGTVIGGAVGLAFPAVGFAIGASVGGVVGGLIDPPKGPHTVGPRLDDLSFQSSTYGAPLARFYGTVPIVGNVFWLEGDKYREVSHTETAGGKGGPKATAETLKYYATFAVSFGLVLKAGQTAKLRRMWIGSNLVFDASGSVVDSTIASHNGTVKITWYDGSDPQSPNPRMQADKGVANVSGYTGLCWAVIEDLDLDPYSRSLEMAQVKVEVTVGNSTPAKTTIASLVSDSTHIITSAVIDRAAITYDVSAINAYGAMTGVDTYRYTYGVGSEHVRWTENIIVPTLYDSGAQVINVCQSPDSGPVTLISLSSFASGNKTVIYRIENGGVISTGLLDSSIYSYGTNQLATVDQTFFITASNSSGSAKLYRFDGVDITAVSSVNVRALSIGHSESLLFVLDYASNSTTAVVKVFDINTLAHVVTYTQSVRGDDGILHVVSDTEFYLRANLTVSRWVNGVASLLNIDCSATTPPSRFGVFSTGSSVYAVSEIFDSGSYGATVELSYDTVPASTALLHDIVTAECSLVGIDASDLDLSALTNSEVRGVRIASSAPRPVLEQLQAIFPFDVTPSGYKLKFVSRGGASVATISESDLGAHASGSDTPVLLPISREMDSQIPATVRVKYLNPAREYDLGEQLASRPGTASVGERTVETTIVLSDTEAARAADVLNKKDWLERRDFGPFSLPPTYGHLEPADVITVPHRGTSYDLRLTRVEYLPDGRLDCSGRLTAAQSYTSTATGVSGAVVGQSTVPLRGPTVAYLLDIPRIRAEQDSIGMAYGLLGSASGWPGGVLLRSDDGSASFQAVGSSNTPARAFVATDALSAHSGYAPDLTSVLTIVPRRADAELYSVTDEQMLANSNLAAYGADGRWEIVSFGRVTDNTGSFTITRFLRGLYGTEWASGLHVAGDHLVMLDTSSVSFAGLPTSAIGTARTWRAVTQGADIDSAANATDIYEANNLLPLAPVDLYASQDQGTKDWTASWQRRTRWPVDLFSGAAVPLGESAELYEVQIWSAAFTALKRTLWASTNSVAYSSAQQVEDHGSIQTTLYIKVRQVSSVVGGGRWLQGAIVAPALGDPYGAFVTSLLHFNGADGSTTIVDVKGNSWACSGTARLSTTSPLYGSASAIFDGGGGSIYSTSAAAFAGGTGDYAIDIAFRLSATGIVHTLADFRPAGTNGPYPCLYVNSTNLLGYYVNTAERITGTTTLSAGVDYRLRIARVSGVTRMFLGGIQEGSSWSDSSDMLVGGTTRPVLGTSAYSAGGYLAGRIDEFRMTVGAGRSAANYTVETTEFTDP